MSQYSIEWMASSRQKLAGVPGQAPKSIGCVAGLDLVPWGQFRFIQAIYSIYFETNHRKSY